MDLIIEARIFDKDQNGINLDLVPEIFIKETREWIEIDKSLSVGDCLLYTSPSPRDRQKSRMPSSA